MSQEDRTRIENTISNLQESLEKVIRQVHQWRRERIERVRKLNEETDLFAIGHLIDDLRRDYAAFPAVCDYLNDVQRNVIESIDEFRHPKGAVRSCCPHFGATRLQPFSRQPAGWEE